MTLYWRKGRTRHDIINLALQKLDHRIRALLHLQASRNRRRPNTGNRFPSYPLNLLLLLWRPLLDRNKSAYFLNLGGGAHH